MKRKPLTLKQIVFFILKLIAASVAYIVFLLVFTSCFTFKWARQIECKQEYLLRPEVYQSVARTLARYSQSDPKLFPKGLSHRWLPTELHRTGGTIYKFNSSGWHIQIGGGFHHYGFDLELEAEISNPATNIWNFSFYDEFDGTRLLETFSLPANETISEAELSAGLLTDERDSNREYICQ